MGKSSVASLLTSVDELFTTQEERDAAKRETVVDIPLSEISDFPNHPFKVKMDEAMMEMADSIRQYGVLVPGMVRPKESGGYEMVAGHRRKMASELAQKPTMPCLVRDLTDDEAIIIMVDSNLQREKILPSEKAFAYKMRLEAMKRQGQRTDLTSVPVAQKSTSRAELGKAVGESQDQVRRYIRLTNLIPELLELMDEGKMAFSVGVELSYLSVNMQFYVLDVIEREDCTPSYSQAFHMHKAMREGTISFQYIDSLMSAEKPNQREVLKISAERVRAFVPKNYNEKQTEEFIVKAVEHYQRYLKRQRDRER